MGLLVLFWLSRRHTGKFMSAELLSVRRSGAVTVISWAVYLFCTVPVWPSGNN